jgi:hypothetical protein
MCAEMMGTATAAECHSQSHKFKGICLSSHNCDKVCATEDFPGGECKLENAMRKCFCKKSC